MGNARSLIRTQNLNRFSKEKNRSMLDTILIVDATMIVGVLFAEAIGRSYGLHVGRSMARWMLIWGLVSLLPFSTSALLAMIENGFTILVTWIGFYGFVAWFFVISIIGSFEKDVQKQEIVKESMLASRLADGWVVVAVLDSGDVVIE
jgi:uncharacterized membrane protein